MTQKNKLKTFTMLIQLIKSGTLYSLQANYIKDILFYIIAEISVVLKLQFDPLTIIVKYNNNKKIIIVNCSV